MLDYVRGKTRTRLLAGEHVHWVARSPRARYIAAVILSAPPWVDRAALRRIQERCRCISALSGTEHHVCHIVPLNHPLVCGLTVPWNLEIKPARVNLAESNHWNNGRQRDLFEEN
jgi:hypothetical protein